MRLVIDISDRKYKWIVDNPQTYTDYLDEAIRNGTPLPKGHGRLIDKDHMIARLEAASKFYSGETADAFDERFSHGLKEAAIRVAEEPTIIEADREGVEE